jgi:hypothetical protein
MGGEGGDNFGFARAGPPEGEEWFISRRAFLARKVEVLSRGLSLNPASEPLLLARLAAQGELLSPSELAAEYSSAIEAAPGSVALHMGRLSVLSRRVAGFGVNAVRAAGAGAVRALVLRAEAAAAGGEPSAAVDAAQRASLLLLLRAAYTERASGHMERGVALLQSAVEMNLHCPPALQGAGVAARAAAFEPFWESEAPKAGEAGAKGWAYFYDIDQHGTRPEPPADIPGPSGDVAQPLPAPADANPAAAAAAEPFASSAGASALPLAQWAHAEAATSAVRGLPLSIAADESAADADPERVVFWEVWGLVYFEAA